MPYWIGFVVALIALGTLRIVGCGDGCLMDEDCDDGDPCTDDRCIGGSCSHAPDTGSLCERNGVPGFCIGGVCEGEIECSTDEDCDDQNECSRDSCASLSPYYYYVCRNEYVEDETPCESDGNPGECRCGACAVDPECSTPEDCDDGNECTSDSCDYCRGSCRNETDVVDCEPCDRGGAPGVCMAGVCEEDPCEGVVCNDGDLCTHDECDCQKGCIYWTGPFDCSDGNPCTEDSCDPRTGCHNSVLPDGTSCGCLRWEDDPDPSCSWFFCPPICTLWGYCRNGECV